MTEQSNWITLQKRFSSLKGLSWLAQEFADMVLRRTVLKDTTISSEDQECLWLLAAMACAAVEKSNSCLILQETPEPNAFTENASDFEQLPIWSELDVPEQSPLDFQKIYQRWPEVVMRYPDTICQDDDSASKAPLRLIRETDGHASLYLTRYRSAELGFAKQLNNLMAKGECASQVTAERVAESCELFCRKQGELSQNHQVQAVVKALKVPFFIVTGGPGTGKTTVLTVILAWHLRQNPKLNIALCAPTGKASKRMKEAVLDGVKKLRGIIDEEIKAKLNELQESTLHSLLGIVPDTGLARRNPTNPLEADLVVVDECSMCDLSLMNQLLLALKPDAKLLLLGDADQLASVDSGMVFADICRWLQARGKMEFLERLTECHRFPSQSPLGGFVQSIIAEDKEPDYKGLYAGQTFLRNSPGDKGKTSCLFLGIPFEATKSREKLKKHPFFSTLPETEDSSTKFTLVELLKVLLTKCDIDWKHWSKPLASKDWTEEQWIAYYYKRAESVKLLGALREGSVGVKRLNAAMQECLGIRDRGNGMPILITQNDKITNLQNGDIGIFFNKKVWFPKDVNNGAAGTASLDATATGLFGKYADMRFVSFNETQLPPHENAFAMTIHKSQGSGYENVFLFLPERDKPSLTRELVYTGITRTQTNCIVIANDQVLKNAIQRKTIRWTGVQALLGQ